MKNQTSKTRTKMKIVIKRARWSAQIRAQLDCETADSFGMWLGHEFMDTTQMYLHANIELKEKALAKTKPFRSRPGRCRPPDHLLAFLQA